MRAKHRQTGIENEIFFSGNGWYRWFKGKREIIDRADYEIIEDEIDWEQRRYEIARDVYSDVIKLNRELYHGLDVDISFVSAKSAVNFADALIAELNSR